MLFLETIVNKIVEGLHLDIISMLVISKHGYIVWLSIEEEGIVAVFMFACNKETEQNNGIS